MTFNLSNYPKQLSDLVIKDSLVTAAIQQCANPKHSRNLLFHGEPGSGKSAALRTLAYHLVGGDKASVSVINVSEITSKASLAKAIRNQCGLNVFTPLGRGVVILEEIDGADDAAQRALKMVIEELERTLLFFATTNNLAGVTKAIQSRFDVYRIAMPEPANWVYRAQAILAQANCSMSVNAVQSLLVKKVPKGSNARDVMRALQDHIISGTAASTTSVSAAIAPTSKVVAAARAPGL